MQYEVEQKHPVADLGRLEAELARRHVAIGPAERHCDTYFNHPARDFAETDEALRIRQIDQANCITYKGPKIDRTSKTRRELELPIAPGDAAARQFAEMLGALGFVKVAVVAKWRRTFRFPFATWTVVGTLDQVDGVGTFVELELTVDDAQLDNARQAVSGLAEELHLGPCERRSYLELLLAT